MDTAAEKWVSEYDFPGRTVTITRADISSVGHYWTGIRRNETLSDPEGAFVVYVGVARDPMGIRAPAEITVKVVIRLTESGDLLARHGDFDDAVVGGLTLWPYHAAGEPPYDHWMWWSERPLWEREPRPWAESRLEKARAELARALEEGRRHDF